MRNDSDRLQWQTEKNYIMNTFHMKRFVKCFSQFIDAKQDFFKRKAPCGQHGAS